MKATSCPLLVKTPLGAKCCAHLKTFFKKSAWVRWVERGLNTRGKCEQGFRRMADRNKPAGIRSLVYGIGKGKADIESLSVFADRGDGKAHFGGQLVVGLAFNYAPQDPDLSLGHLIDFTVGGFVRH